MRKSIAKVLCVLVATALVSCDTPEQFDYRGGLYFARGPYLMRFSLRDGSLTVVDNLGDKTIRDIDGLGPDKLLLAETATVNRKSVARISWIDLKTGETAALYAGVLARYLTEAGVIVYDDGTHLFAVPLRDPGNDEIIFTHRQHRLTAMTEASNDNLLFETGGADEAAIHSWNALTGDVRRLDALTAACRLNGAVWIDTLQRLACKQRAPAWTDAAYVLVGLDGVIEGNLNLPDDKQFLALAYISGQNALILKETWRSMFGQQEQSGVWVHDIRSGESRRLARNQNLGTSVVYTEF